MDYVTEVDHDVDAAYFRFTNNKVVETEELDEPGFEDYIFDLDENGELVGVEVLNYSEHAQDLGDDAAVWNRLGQYPGFHLR